MTKNSLIQYSAILLISGLLAACGSKPAAENQQPIDTVLIDSNAQALDAIDALITQLPKPSDIPNLIARTGAEYQSKLINPLENGEKVTESRAKSAFSIGVYGADVAYMAAYDHGQEAMKTFVIGKKLADRIGVSGAFDQSLVDRIEKNLNNKDSLIMISDMSISHSTDMLKTQEQLKEATLLAAGGLIEGLYLACGLIHLYPPTGLPQKEQDKILVPLVGSVIMQEKTLGGLIELLNKVNDNDADLTMVVNKLMLAQAIYTKAGWQQKMQENKGNLIPTEKDIHELAQTITEIRNALTQ